MHAMNRAAILLRADLVEVEVAEVGTLRGSFVLQLFQQDLPARRSSLRGGLFGVVAEEPTLASLLGRILGLELAHATGLHEQLEQQRHLPGV